MFKNHYDKVMIVCHPDDETFWGGNALSKDKNWLVICLTNAENLIRKNKFRQVMRIFNAENQIFNFPDNPKINFSKNEINEMSNILSDIINDKKVTKVVTHNPNGEYGHPAHKFISNLITSLIINKNKLFYFDFATKKKTFYKEKKEALKIYLDDNYRLMENKTSEINLSNKTVLLKKLFKTLIERVIQSNGKYIFNLFLKIFKIKKNVILFNENFESKILSYRSLHYLSNFEELTKCSDYDNRALPRNFIDVYISRREHYEKYQDRKFIITEFLPTCNGKTLSVGCHIYNKNDSYCLPNPENYETIDLDEKWSVYGSQFKHTTIDFLDYNPKYKFDNIILFGVLDIFPRDGDTDTYSLYKKEDQAISKMDSLLSKTGRVLLGPDLNYFSNNETKEQKIHYWRNFSNTNKILKNYYKTITQFVTPNNYIIVLQKNKIT